MLMHFAIIVLFESCALVASFQLEKPLTVNNGSQLPIDTVTFFAISALQQVWQNALSVLA